MLSELNTFVLDIALPSIVYWLEFFAVVWIPVVLTPLAWGLWVQYVRKAWLHSQKFVLLEIKLPQETFKSPAAMELVLTALYQTSGEGTPIDRYWEGKMRPWFSLELVSIGGEVKFFIWTFASQKATLEANIYAQYPDITIHEVEDYTKKVVYDPAVSDLWGCEFLLAGKDAYPIKTYVDYGLDKDPDEEFKVDPMAPVIEFLGSIKKDENVWIQIIVRAHKKEKTVFNNDMEDNWVKEAKEEIKKIIEETAVENAEGKKVPNQTKLTEGQKEKIIALERSVSKYGFDTGIRGLYLAPREIYNKGNQGGIAGALKQFGAANLNGFKPKAIGFDYKWQDFNGKKEAKQKRTVFDMYGSRSYFHRPYVGHRHTLAKKPFILNTEELATIFHFPGSAVRTPNLKRIPSKRADAPANLPI